MCSPHEINDNGQHDIRTAKGIISVDKQWKLYENPLVLPVHSPVYYYEEFLVIDSPAPYLLLLIKYFPALTNVMSGVVWIISQYIEYDSWGIFNIFCTQLPKIWVFCVDKLFSSKYPINVKFWTW